MKSNIKKLYQLCLYAKRKAKHFYTKTSVNGKPVDVKTSTIVENAPVNSEKILLTEAFHQHVFDTVVKTICSQANHLRIKPESVSKQNCIYNYLDLYPSDLYFIFKELEQKTLLNLIKDEEANKFFVYFFRDNKNNIVYNVVTVGSICDFIEKKFLQANHAELLQKANEIAMKHKLVMNCNLEKQDNTQR